MMKTAFATARTIAGASTVGAIKTGAIATGVALRPRQ
jgi:hypothetical protein